MPVLQNMLSHHYYFVNTNIARTVNAGNGFVNIDFYKSTFRYNAPAFRNVLYGHDTRSAAGRLPELCMRHALFASPRL